MDPRIYTKMRETEDHHWWFVGRRQILHSVLDQLSLPADCHILDIGCGTGGNLATYRKFGTVEAMELDPEARHLADARGICEVQKGALPDQIPFPANYADLIMLTDVLEHIDDDLATLEALRERLKPGGRIVLTVPAFQFLWSQHDEELHHKRRYRRYPLIRLAESAGLKVDYISYCNFWLFPMIASVRLLQMVLQLKMNDHEAPSLTINRLFKGIFSSEARLIPHMNLPFGVSLIAVLENKFDAQ